MSNQGSQKSLTEVFKTVKEGITALIGFITVLIGFVRLVLDETGLLTAVFLVIGIVTLLGICGYVYFTQVTIRVNEKRCGREGN